MNLRQYFAAKEVIGYAGTALAFILMLIGAVTANPWLFAVGAVGTYAMDVALMGLLPPEVSARLQQLRMGVTTRGLLRQVLLLALLAAGGVSARVLSVVILSLLVLFALQFTAGVTVRMLGWRRKLPVVTRNIDLGPLRIPDSPPMTLIRSPMSRLLPLDAFLVAGVTAFVISGLSAMVTVGAVVAIGLTAVYQLVIGWHLWRSRTIPRSEAVMRHVQRWLDDYQPHVVLYFSGSPEGAYQVNMWLDCLAKLSLRPVIVLRERTIAAQLAPTTVPVLCVPVSTDLMALDFGPARVALYPANTGKNIHMLRDPRLRHVFIGHGDSDKIASINPFTKVHDEVWTAGKAGRDRYTIARVGVRDDTIVEVGRPQLDALTGTDTDATRPTVLYAPTWEGWTDEPGNTSLIDAGPRLIELLLKAKPGVRVLYKPHPFTGIRSSRARTAHKRIVDLIKTANGTTGPALRSAALTTLDRKLASFDDEISAHDEAHHSREEGKTGSGVVERLRVLSDQWHDTYWSDNADGRHLVIEGPRPSLYSCFHHADLLISDISSVVSDFIATEKPYAITNCAGISDEDFRTANPTSQAAYLLAPDGSGLDEALLAIRQPEADHRADERRGLREYLLGPREPSSQSRFDEALRDLYMRASEQHPVTESSSGSDAVAAHTSQHMSD